MAEILVTESSANIAKDSALQELARIVNQLATLANELKTDHNALLAKLDLDAGVTDTDYAALHSTAAANADTLKFRATGVPA